MMCLARHSSVAARQLAGWNSCCNSVILFHKTKKKKKARKEKEVFKGGKRLQGGDAELQLRHTCLCVYGCVRFCVSPVCGCRTMQTCECVFGWFMCVRVWQCDGALWLIRCLCRLQIALADCFWELQLIYNQSRMKDWAVDCLSV